MSTDKEGDMTTYDQHAAPEQRAVEMKGLALARARRASGMAQEQALNLADIVLQALGSNFPVDRVGEVRIRFEKSHDFVDIPFPGPGSAVILDEDGNCVGIYRDPPGQAEECPPKVSVDPLQGGMSGG